MEQRSEEWYQARLGKATASKFHVICSKRGVAGRENYKYELIAERLTGNPTETKTYAPMQHGIEYEDTARLMYEFKTGYKVDQTGFLVHPDYPDAGASPDGLVGEDGGVEIKCFDTKSHIEALYKRKIPTLYYEQVLGGLWVTGRKWWDFVSYDPRMPEDLQLVIIRLERNEDDITQLRETILSFCNDVDKELMKILEYREKL
jgi:putative phage-type endonuclease